MVQEIQRNRRFSGSLPNQPPGNNLKIRDWEKFRDFANTHGDKTQEEMAQLWPEEISSRTISRGLKKIGFTRKKKLMVIEKEMKLKGKYLRKK